MCVTKRTNETNNKKVSCRVVSCGLVYMIDLKPRCFVPFVLPSRLLDPNHRHPGLTQMDSPLPHLPSLFSSFLSGFSVHSFCSFLDGVHSNFALSFFSCFQAAFRQQQQATQQAKQVAGPRAQGWVVVCCIGWRKDRGIIIMKIKMQEA